MADVSPADVSQTSGASAWTRSAAATASFRGMTANRRTFVATTAAGFATAAPSLAVAQMDADSATATAQGVKLEHGSDEQ
jgi:hypothetical protein